MSDAENDLSHDSLSARIYHRLRREFMAGLHKPGNRLSIRKLAVGLNTSPTPVREAVFQLAREGALDLRAGYQPRVPVLDIETYIHIRDTRLPLERLAGELAAVHITPDTLLSLEAAHDRYTAACSRQNWRAAIEANQAFHFTICRAARNDVLVAAIENLWLLTGPFVAQHFPHSVDEPADNHPHLMIIDALTRRSPAEAGDLVARDLRDGSNRIIARFRETAAQKPAPRRR